MHTPEATADFWERAAEGDAILTRLVVAAGAPATGDADDVRLLVAYQDAFRLRSSARERDSVISHLRDLADLVPESSPLAADLRGVADSLSAWTTVRRG